MLPFTLSIHAQIPSINSLLTHYVPALPGNEPGTDCKPEDLLPLDLQLSHIHALDYTHHPNHEQWHCPRWAGNTFKREQEMGVRKENDHVSFTLSKPANPRLPPQHQESRHASPASPHRGTLMMMTHNQFCGTHPVTLHKQTVVFQDMKSHLQST